MKPYVVEMRVITVVMGEDEDDAYSNALSDWSEIAGDSQPIVDIEREVFCAKDLPTGWDMRCLPYCGDGRTRLEDLVAAATQQEKSNG